MGQFYSGRIVFHAFLTGLCVAAPVNAWGGAGTGSKATGQRALAAHALCDTSFAGQKPVSMFNPSMLHQTIVRTIASLPLDARPLDIEAALSFALDQSGNDHAVLAAAVENFDVSKISPAAARAIRSVHASLLTDACRGGTGGTMSDTALGLGPEIAGGGLSSDYAQP